MIGKKGKKNKHEIQERSAYRKNRGIQKQKIHGNTVNIRKIYKLINCLDTPQGIFKHTLQKNMQENKRYNRKCYKYRK